MKQPAITVYRYRAFDPDTGDWVVQLSKATEDHIKQVGGTIIAGTAEEVDSAALTQGRYFGK